MTRSKQEESIQLSVKLASRKYQERSRKGQDFINLDLQPIPYPRFGVDVGRARRVWLDFSP